MTQLEQAVAVENMITELEDYYVNSDFAVLVSYHLDPSYLNGKNEEEYGGWTFGYKVPNQPKVLIRHFEGEVP
ncbi:hypothetical protein J14TS2_12370 [Bacillus sp. J14TS2]|uniref:hypothetical protein n=1 Tax=Bacillus sp. J14TS2 TaxID=2807188 RepID=UPI001B183011|nr:hypothetical protein [Bacillus sp. J14TS2]GIN70762.1 hypothetical protein J14TS2_12370 [Bacillus sp. J14TS2]